MRKRLYKFSPDYKLKFSRILNALGLSTPAEGGWFLKVYENTGWFGTWKCFYESELYFGMEQNLGTFVKYQDCLATILSFIIFNTDF